MYLEKRTSEGWERKKQYNKDWWKQLPHQRLMLYAAKRRAKKNKLEFNLTEEDIIIPNRCPILDVPLIKSKEKQKSNSPSLDRIDNTKGYIKGNVRVISLKANSLKNNMTLFQIEALYNYVFGLS